MTINITGAPKLYVFVLMPFAKEFDDIYQLGIKSACEEIGMYCERVDETHVLGPIYDKIITSIAKADIVIADLTGRNANVYYETGYAHALSKITIHLCQDVKEIPFDLLGFQHVIYSGRIVDLKTQLKSKLEWAKEFIKTKGQEIGSLSFDFYSAGKEIVGFVDGNLSKTYSPDGKVVRTQTDAQIDILNSGASMSQKLGPVYIYTPNYISKVYNPRSEKGEDSAIYAASEIQGYERRHQIDFKEVFAAGEWKSLPLVFHSIGASLRLDKDSFEIPIKIRFLTESTPLDLDVSVQNKVVDTTDSIEVLFAQEKNPKSISVKPIYQYERDGRIDEAAFQISVAFKNMSTQSQKIGPIYVYTNNAVVKLNSSGMFFMGMGDGNYEGSDIEGYVRKFIINNMSNIGPYEYENSMLGFELERTAFTKNLSEYTLPVMLKIFTSSGPIIRSFDVVFEHSGS